MKLGVNGKWVFPFLFLICGFFHLILAQNTRWDRKINRIEKKLNKGKFFSAQRLADRTFRKLQKKSIDNKRYHLKVNTLQSNILQQLGHFDSSRQVALQALRKTGGLYSDTALITNLTRHRAAKVLLKQGVYFKADSILEQAIRHFPPSSFSDSLLYIDIYLDLLNTRIERGALDSSNALFNILTDLIQRRPFGFTTQKDPVTGDSKRIPVREKVKEERLRDQATLKRLEGKLYMAGGNYPKAISLLRKNLQWIEENLKKRERVYVQTLESLGDVEKNFNQPEKAAEHFKKAYQLSHRNLFGLGLKDHHPEVLDRLEKLLEQYITMDKKGKAQKYLKRLYQIIYYSGDNEHYYQLHFIRANTLRWMNRNDFEMVKEKIHALEEIQNKWLPPQHVERILNNELRYRYYLKKNQLTQARKIKNKIIRLTANLYGSRSPLFIWKKLYYTGFDLNFDYKIDHSLNILTGQYWKIYRNNFHTFHKNYTDILNHRAQVFLFTDQFDQARLNLEQSLDILATTHGKNSSEYASQLLKLARLDLKAARFDSARERLELAKKIINDTKGNASIEYATVLELFSELYSAKGKYDEAVSSLEKAFELKEKIQRRKDIYIKIDPEKLASIYIQTGEYEEAEEILTESLRKKEKELEENHFLLIVPNYLMGKNYLLMGEFVKAEKHTRRSLNVAQNVLSKNSLRYLNILKQLAEIYSSRGDYEKAETITEKVIGHQKQNLGPEHVEVAHSLVNLALIRYYRGNDPGKSRKLVIKARKILESNFGKQHPEYAEATKNLALFEKELGNLDTAQILLEEAFNIWKDAFGRKNYYTGQALLYQGDLQMKKGNFSKARRRYRKAKRFFRGVFNKNHPRYVASLSRIAKAHYYVGNSRRALNILEKTNEHYLTFIKKYFPFLSDNEKTKYWALLKSDFDFYFSIAIKRSIDKPKILRQVYNFRLATKALLLGSAIQMQQRILNSGDSAMINRFRKWIDKKEKMAKLISMPASEENKSGYDLQKLKKETNLLEKKLSESSLAFAHGFQEKYKTWEEVSNTLDKDEVAIEVIRYNKASRQPTDSVRYAFLLLTQKTAKHPKLVLIKDGNSLENRHLKYYRNSIKLNARNKYSYNAYWKKIDNEIPDGKTVYFSPDGVYNQVNPESFKKTGDQYVIENNNIILVSNTKDLLLDHSPRPDTAKNPKSAFLFGNPDLNVNSDTNKKITYTNNPVPLYPLPGAEKEINSISSLLRKYQWKTKVFTGETAREESIKEIKNPRILHLATHGYFEETPQAEGEKFHGIHEKESHRNPLLRSGLLLANAGVIFKKGKHVNFQNGILTAYEAKNLHLFNTRLVVLSACETGLGEISIGEGVYGLQRAFLVAGASTVVMTLFKISDEITRELMTNFYKRWMQSGDKKKAFREAKLHIKNKYELPVYWGSFVMMSLN